MRRTILLSLLAGGVLLAQTPTKTNPLLLPPETVVGVVDGVNVTVDELQFVMTTSAPQLQEQLKKNPQELLRYYGFARRLAKLAEEGKLEEESPYRERIRIARMQILAEAQLTTAYTQMEVKPDQLRKYFDDHKDRYASAKVKVIYVPFIANAPKPAGSGATKVLTEQEAREKVEKIMEALRGGADFVKMVKLHSEHAESAAKDGDFGAIRGSDNYPAAVKKAVFAAKAGEIAGPVRLGNGFYIFKVEENSTPAFESVQGQVGTEIRDERWKEWMDKVRNSVEIKLLDAKPEEP